MWKLLAASALLAATGAATPLRAAELPWCVELDVFTKNCAFERYDECVSVANNAGAKCIRNSKFQAPAKPESHNSARKTSTAGPQR